MPDFEKIWKFIIDLLKNIFGDAISPLIIKLIGYGFLIALVLCAIWGLLYILSKIIKIWRDDFLPMFSNPDEKAQRQRRQQFANHIERKIRDLNSLEAWSDNRFTELEAEVEAEGGKSEFSIIPFFKKKQSGLRREQSLSKALNSSQERLILLEGDPGSGKSVALRYVAQSMASRAMKAKNLNALIPIYVNLKELDRSNDVSIDRNLIEKFVLHSLNRANDRDIEEFLENEFHEGIQNGTWLFLFDSFDELPEILSSTEADETIRRYGDAISDFLHGMNKCRGIIASRQFRGPGRLGWPRFRILPLSEKRRSELIHRAILKSETEKEIIGQLGLALPEIRSMAINPMFLGLLCEHMKSERPFPKNAHSVFETYIEARLNRDETRLWKRFNLKPTEVRRAAECIAFTMTADRQTGLSPSRETLKKSLMNTYGEITEKLGTYLDALEFIKLARSETATSAGISKSFTFSHRRFQEYFATCVVLREPGLVTPIKLLTDARWRETAVTMCQTQPREVLSPILDEAQHIFAKIIDKMPNLIEDPMEYVQTSTDKENDGKQKEIFPQPFSWPQGLLHICGLLQDGFSNHMSDLPQEIMMYSARIILSASEQGTLYDKKWGLELAGITPQPVLLYLLRIAYKCGSQWLKEVAYRQVARLPEIPKDIALWIRQALISLLLQNRLKRDIHTTRAHLARLDKSSTFLSVLNLLLWVPIIDLILNVLFLLFAFYQFIGISFSGPQFGGLLAISLLLIGSHKNSVLFFLNINIVSDKSIVLITFMGVYLKLSIFALFFLISRFFLHYRGALNSVLISILALYFIGWKASGLYAARSMRYTHPLFWPILPIIIPFIAVIKNANTVFSIIIKKWKTIIMVFLIYVIFISLIVIFINSHIMKILLIVFGTFSVGMFFFLVYLKIKNWIRWGKWQKKQNRPMSANDFLMLINQYRQRSILQKYINTVREKSLLEPTKEMETLLESLVVAVEQQIKIKEFGSKANKVDLENQIQKTISKSTDLAHWYENLSNKNISSSKKVSFLDKDIHRYPLAHWRNQVLDELSMLLEQVRLRRRD